MKTRIRLLCCAMTLLIATAAAACAGGQTSSGGNASSGSDAPGNRDSQTSYIGKVTSVTGNQVELALGTVNGKKSGETSSGADGFKGEPCQPYCMIRPIYALMTVGEIVGLRPEG